MNDIIPHSIEGEVVEQRVKDGYINATVMCKAAGKRFFDYHRLDTTQAFIGALEAETGIPASEQIQVVKGGFPELQGTWIHPHVAVNLATWLSPTFAVQVAKWVFEWMTQGRPPLKTFERLVRMYLAQGRTEEWIHERIEGILTRRELTDEWHRRGVKKPIHYAILTRMLQLRALGIGPKEHRELKGLGPHDSLRNHSTEVELLLTRLGEKATIEIARAMKAHGYEPNKVAAVEGGEIAKTARLKLEALTSEPVASPINFLPNSAGKAISSSSARVPSGSA